jgi:hypothetical protein
MMNKRRANNLPSPSDLHSQREGPAVYALRQDEPTNGSEAQRRREQMSKMEKAEGEMPKAYPGCDPAKKKTGEF